MLFGLIGLICTGYYLGFKSYAFVSCAFMNVIKIAVMVLTISMVWTDPNVNQGGILAICALGIII